MRLLLRNDHRLQITDNPMDQETLDRIRALSAEKRELHVANMRQLRLGTQETLNSRHAKMRAELEEWIKCDSIANCKVLVDAEHRHYYFDEEVQKTMIWW